MSIGKSFASVLAGAVVFVGVCRGGENEGEKALAAEVAGQGRIVYCARAENGTWDLFVSRPDGSQRKNVTNTKDFEEAAPRWSPDGRRLLYRRIEAGAVIDHDKWGFQGQLMVADANGAGAEAFGAEREFPWATWSPDAKQIVCLEPKGIMVYDFQSRKLVRQMSRQGIYQQLYWSPDGKYFCGVANTKAMWTIVRMDAETGELNAVREFQNCAPDWFPDSEHLIFSSRPGDQGGYGWTQLWMAKGDGTEHRLVYGEEGFHIYGGALSPDGKYVLLSKCPDDGGGAEKVGAPIYIVRFADTPMITGKSESLRKKHPETKDGPMLYLADGWEPHWTYGKTGESK